MWYVAQHFGSEAPRARKIFPKVPRQVNKDNVTDLTSFQVSKGSFCREMRQFAYEQIDRRAQEGSQIVYLAKVGAVDHTSPVNFYQKAIGFELARRFKAFLYTYEVGGREWDDLNIPNQDRVVWADGKQFESKREQLIEKHRGIEHLAHLPHSSARQIDRELFLPAFEP